MSFSHMGIEDFPFDPALQDQWVMVGHPEAVAFAWLTAYAQNLSEQCADEEYGHGEVSVAELIRTADSHQPESASRWGGDYISRGGAFEGFSMDPTFWKMYAQFRGKDLSEVEEAHFFSCSC